MTLQKIEFRVIKVCLREHKSSQKFPDEHVKINECVQHHKIEKKMCLLCLSLKQDDYWTKQLQTKCWNENCLSRIKAVHLKWKESPFITDKNRKVLYSHYLQLYLLTYMYVPKHIHKKNREKYILIFSSLGWKSATTLNAATAQYLFISVQTIDLHWSCKIIIRQGYATPFQNNSE